MKIEDFKDWDKPEYIKNAKYIIKTGGCFRIRCDSCQFRQENNVKNKFCYDVYCDDVDITNSPKLVESAKEFKKMVEEEKEKQIGVSIHKNNLEKVEDKQKKYIIWNPKGQNPRHIHNSRKEAEKEAERLANANPNQEFYVLKVLKKAKGTVKVEWE